MTEAAAVKAAYGFATNMAASYKLATMILPQLEQGTHGVTVAGMFSVDDNTYAARSGDPVGERPAKIDQEQGILLMICDQCALRRDLTEGEPSQCGTGEVKARNTVAGVVAGCFPQLYQAQAGNMPDQVVTL